MIFCFEKEFLQGELETGFMVRRLEKRRLTEPKKQIFFGSILGYFVFSLDKRHKFCYNNFRCDASVAQLVERILGKDEVTGSIPVRSSTNKIRSRKRADFCLYYSFFIFQYSSFIVH